VSITTLSNCFSDARRGEEAVHAIERAVQLYRVLAAELPAKFNPALTSSHANHSIVLDAISCHEEALTAIEEAVQLYWPLALGYPAEFNCYRYFDGG
jgi:predicted RNase H-like HicB family nuclease